MGEKNNVICTMVWFNMVLALIPSCGKLGLGGGVMSHVDCGNPMEGDGRRWNIGGGCGWLWMAVESCGRIRNVGESYRIHWGFVEGYGSLWNIGVHRIGNT